VTLKSVQFFGAYFKEVFVRKCRFLSFRGAGHYFLAILAGWIAEHYVHRILGFAPHEVGFWHGLSQLFAFCLVFFGVLYAPVFFTKRKGDRERD
jgi:hypothetical protein